MGVFESIRRLRLPGILVLLGLWSLGPLTGILRDALTHDHEEDAVASSRIHAPASERVICHHHPEGCPKDCFCPKIVPEQEEGAEHSHPASSLNEPSLVQCTDGVIHELPPALVAFWPGHLPRIPDLSGPGEASLPSRPLLPRDPFRDPPLTVPRA